MNQNKLGLSFELIARQYGTMAPLLTISSTSTATATAMPALPVNSGSILENRPALQRHDRLPGLQVHGLDGHGDAVPANRMHDQKYTVYDEHTPTAAEKKHHGDTESPIDYMILRYADILLMYAEAKNR